jgi:transposase-like protein
MLTRADEALRVGKSMQAICTDLMISQQTYYRWRRGNRLTKTTLIDRLREIGMENARLKKQLAKQSLDLIILKAASEVTRPFLTQTG